MTFAEKLNKLRLTSCVMNSSKLLCMKDAIKCYRNGNLDCANKRIERAADYAFGVFGRPLKWRGKND